MAFNKKAWEAVLKSMPNHYYCSTGPCCDRCSTALQIATDAIKSVPVDVDDPEADGTDWAHPAWWRGYDHGSAICMNEVNRILDGVETLKGTCNEPWQTLRERLFYIRQLLGLAERVITSLHYSSKSQLYMTITQWYAIRNSWMRRRQNAERG